VGREQQMAAHPSRIARVPHANDEQIRGTKTLGNIL